MDTGTHTLTQRLIQEACETFQKRCYSHTLRLQDLCEEMVKTSREISKSLSTEQVLILLQEHPEWTLREAELPGKNSIAVIVAEQLAYIIRHTINEQWAVLLLK